MELIILLILIVAAACICVLCARALVAAREIWQRLAIMGGARNYGGRSIMARLLKQRFDMSKHKETINNARRYTVGESQFKQQDAYSVVPCYDLDYTFAIHPNDVVVQKYLAKGIPYEKILISALAAFCKDDGSSVVFDVGANIGTVSIPLSRVAQVYAFEPFPANFALLKENIKINKSTVRAIESAIGDVPRASISLSSAVSASPEEIARTRSRNDFKKEIPKTGEFASNFHFAAVQIGTGGKRVPMHTIDELDTHIDVIKVDVEGAEPLVFYGARDTIARDLPVIAFERNDAIVSDEMRAVLGCSDEAATFDVVAFCRDLGYDTIYEVPFDNFILTHPSHVLRPGAIFNRIPIHALSRQAQFNAHGFSLYRYMAPWKKI